MRYGAGSKPTRTSLKGGSHVREYRRTAEVRNHRGGVVDRAGRLGRRRCAVQWRRRGGTGRGAADSAGLRGGAGGPDRRPGREARQVVRHAERPAVQRDVQLRRRGEVRPGAADRGSRTKDESGRKIKSQAIDYKALAKVKPVADEDGPEKARRAYSNSPRSAAGWWPEPTVSHTKLTLTDPDSRTPRVVPLDTVVSYQLSLGGLPVAGQGAKLRITFGPDGKVSQLSHALRKVERAGDVPVITGRRTAMRACAALYGAGRTAARADARLPVPRAHRGDARRQGHGRHHLPAVHLQPGRRERNAGAPARPGRARRRPGRQARRRTQGRHGERDDLGRPAAPPRTPTPGPRRSTALRGRGRTGTSIAYQRAPRDREAARRAGHRRGHRRERPGRHRHGRASTGDGVGVGRDLPGRRRVRRAGHRPDRRRHRADRRRVAVRPGQRERLQVT